MNRPTPDEIRSIYTGIEALPLTPDLQGWNSDGPIFRELIELLKPQTIIEVGTWKGRSAIGMVNIARGLGLSPVIYCVDVWIPPIGVGLGEFPRTQIPEHWSRPTFYHQFLANVKHAGADDMLIPVRGLTQCSAWCLGAWGVQADLIYVDANHESPHPYNDMKAYWPLLRPGGIMFGDDFSSHPGVADGVRKFAAEHWRGVREVPAAEGTQWVLEPK